MKRFLFTFSFFLFALLGQSQNTYKLKDNIQFGGYLKYMQTNSIQNVDTILTDNLFHNRLNLKIKLPAHFTFGAGLRIRAFYGEVTKIGIAAGKFSGNSYSDQLKSYDGVMNLERTWVSGNSLIINSIMDRLWLNYSKGNWDVRVGRQRVNWGLNTVWNPNDLFNALNYIDFDYEERQGSDAVRVQYYLGEMSSIEFAYKFAKDRNNDVGAIKYKFNTHTYDIQLLAGKYQQDLAAGFGWAGNIKQFGFKGEGTYFVPFDSIGDVSGSLSFSTTLEYGFKNGWSGMVSYLLNTAGVDKPLNGLQLSTMNPNAKSLMPNTHTVFVNFMKPISPVFSANIGGFYGFGVNWLIFFPTVTYSIKQNWDVDLVGQLFWGDDIQGQFTNQGNGVFLRLKWSF
tara:strand:+ start:24768 stop:25955 length:1188 start_codon:yes stop_codon:yes gene_type:complete